MKRHAMLGLATATLLFTAGCQKSEGPSEQSPAGVTNETEAMKYYAANDEFVVNDEQTFADKSIEPMEYGTFGISKTDAAVTPLRYGRFITSITRTVTTTIQAGDTTAIALVEKTIVGTLKIRAKTGAGDTVTIEKPFTDQSKRNVLFARVNRDTKKYWLNWVPVASSLVEGGTVAPHNGIEITRLVLLPAGGDSVVITDPERHYLRYKWLRFWHAGAKGDVPELLGGQLLTLRVTVRSSSPDSDVVALRYGFDVLQRRRVLLTLVSETMDGSDYIREYETSRTAHPFVHFFRGSFNLGVDAMTRATLYDDDVTKYSVSWWGIPYRVF